MATRTHLGWWTLAIGWVLCATTAPAWAVDTDGDGVDDAIDVCNNTPPGIPVDAVGRPLGDIDLDCDVDLDDFALFQQSMTGPLAPPEIVIETVPVGNTGNAPDVHGAGYGAVNYVYNIGKYEVTAGQYTAFLNAVARVDTYELYNTGMWSDTYGCKIQRGGSSRSYTYSVAPDWAERPVNFVSWGDAARFANWLHNGQPIGAQDLSTTEDGSYYLNGATSSAALMAVTRKADATWVIPSEDEWYKAAYHMNDGVTGNYWDYSTGTDTAPTSEAPPGTNMTDGSANYYGSTYAIGAPYYRTEVGAYNAKPSDSPYGTFDQGGNVWEWNETIVSGSTRGLRGNSFYRDASYMRASYRGSDSPSYQGYGLGFRVAEVD